MGKGGGGGGQTTSYSTSLPPYAREPYLRNIERAEAATDEPYQPYFDQRISDFTPETLTAQEGVRQLSQRGTPGVDAGLGYADFATQSALGATGYTPTAATAATPGVSTGIFDQAAADFYMSPYISNVIDRQRGLAELDYARSRQGRQAEYAKAGAFGGSRAVVDDLIARDQFDRQLQDMEARLLDQAYVQAQGQFERDQARGLQAQTFNVESLLQQELENERFRQAGIGLGLTGSELGLRGAGQIADLDIAGQEQTLDQLRNLTAVGQDIQNLEQRSLDLAYEDFINQRDFPRQNAAFMSGILSSIPVSTQQEAITSTSVSPINQFLGLGLGSLGLYNAFNQ